MRRIDGPRVKTASSFGPLLRHWRLARRMSQLALAAEAEISGRHLCFLETGRAQPSREMVHLLANVLDISLTERNAWLLAAGYAPAYGEHKLEEPELEHVRRALTFVLNRQEPYPALVVDDAWNAIMRNSAAQRPFGLFQNASAIPPEHARNAMHMICHPEGMRRFIVNWEDFAGPLIQMIHREAASGTNPGAARLRDELLAYSGMPPRWKIPDSHARATPVLTMRLKKGDLCVTFFSTLTMLATPHDITLEQLRIECFYPADSATEETARRLAANAT